VNIPELIHLREEAKRWEHRFRAAGLPRSSARELFAVFVLLRWADLQEAEEQAMAEFEERQWSPILPSHFRWRVLFRLAPPELAQALSDLQEFTSNQRLRNEHALAANLSALSEPLSHLSKVDVSAVAESMQWFAEQPFETLNDRRQLLDFFDVLIGETADGPEGQFHSPSSVAALVAAIADPRPGERVYDPCFGSGSFLTAAWDHAQRSLDGSLRRRPDSLLSIFGIEINRSAYLVGLTRLILAGVVHPHLECGNSLEREPSSSFNGQGFDVVLANPPIAARFAEETWQYHHFPIRTKDSTGLFIQHVLQQLGRHGRAVIAVPEGFLFRLGPEQELRRYLVERGHVEAIVSLPEGAFAPYTMVRGSLIVLRKEGAVESVRIVDSQPFFRKVDSGRGLALPGEQLSKLTALVKGSDGGSGAAESVAVAEAEVGPGGNQVQLAFRASPKIGSEKAASVWNLSATELAASEWDLSPRRREKGGLDSLLSAIREALRDRGEIVRLSDCAEIFAGRSIPSTHLMEQLPNEKSNKLKPSKETVEILKLYDTGLSDKEIANRLDLPTASVRARLAHKTMGTYDEEKVSTAEGEKRGRYHDEEFASYVRIKDIHKNVASQGSSSLGAEALNAIDPNQRLQAGDILLSKSGTIGKAGIVRNGAVGGVAANGLYVVRVDRDRLDPNFLLAYFRSSACQNWLSSQSRGTVIQHLNRPVLNSLAIPLPSMTLQLRAADQFREYGRDVLEFLAQALGARDHDPIASWIAESLSRLPVTADSITDPLIMSPVESLWETLRPLRNQAAHAEIKSPLVPWILALAESLKLLQSASQVPKSPALLNLIQESSRALRSAQQLVHGSLPDESQAWGLTDFLMKWLHRAAKALLTEVNLVLTPTASTMQLGEMVEEIVSVENRSPLPLRSLTIESSPNWGKASFGFIGEGQQGKLTLRGEAPKVVGLFSVSVSWSAITLDGQLVNGERQLSFDVVEGSGIAAGSEELGGSPYVTGSPVERDRDDVFFGREALLQQISRQISTSGNVALLEGNRRSGKTSILRHLEGANSIPGWLGVYCSLQGAEGSGLAVGIPTAEVFREIASSVAKALIKLKVDVPLPNGGLVRIGESALGVGRACREGISEASPFADFRDYLEVALGKLAEQGLGMVLMLDEFDKLQEGIDHGITSPQVPENIRFLVQTYPRFSAILTGSRRLKRLREEYWSALYGLGTRIGVTALDADDARRLVNEPVKGKLTFSPEAVERAVSITACQPYLLQCLCNRIFDFAARTKARSVTLDTVEEASAALVKDNEHFASLWDYAGLYRRRLILMLCSQRSGPSEQVSFGELQELLTQRGIELKDEQLDADLAHLRELELIDLVGKIGDAHYQLSIPLMGAWIEEQQDFDVVLSKARAESEDENA
jgi:hypothetical protein